MPTPLVSSEGVRDTLVLTIHEPHLRGYAASERLKKESLAALGSMRQPKVVLDFGAVVSLSTEVIRSLLSLRRHTQEAGGRLVLCGLSGEVEQALTATRLIGNYRSSAGAFEVQPDLSGALDSLDQPSPEG